MNSRIRTRSSAVLAWIPLLIATPPVLRTAWASPAPKSSFEVDSRATLTPDEVRKTLAKLAALPSTQDRSREWLASLARWSRSPGRKMTSELLWSQVMDSRVSESDRYLCLQAAAELSGPELAPRLESMLRSRGNRHYFSTSWMLRSAAIQSLARLNARESGGTLLHVVLEDPALVVRLEAVRAIAVLRPVGAEAALLAAAEDPRNWNQDRPVWIPERAIQALEAIRGEIAPALASTPHPLKARIAYWKARLSEPPKTSPQN